MSAGLTGEQVRSLRVERGLTQRQAAEMLGVSQPAVVQAEKKGIKRQHLASRWEATLTTATPPPPLKVQVEGDYLRARRLLLGLTQAQVGERLGGLTQDAVRHAERYGIAHVSNLGRWAQALEVTPEELCAPPATRGLDLLCCRARALRRELDEVTAQIAALVGEAKP